MSRQGALVSVVRESWKLSWKRLLSELAPQSKTGGYTRPVSKFQSKNEILDAEPGRYYVYLGNPCPWCHRVALSCAFLDIDVSSNNSGYLTLSKLEDDPIRASRGGWAFSERYKDLAFGSTDLVGVYQTCSPGYDGKYTAPVLIDKKEKRIISNESKDIMRLLRQAKFIKNQGTLTDLRPEGLDSAIEEKNKWTYENVNNAVYRAGFTTEQGPYEEAADAVTNALTSLDQTLSSSRFIHGDCVTESDIYLLPTMVRFDAIYAVLFRCTGKRVADCPHIVRWMKDMYAFPRVAETYDHQDAVRSYYQQMFPLYPSRIIPKIAPLFP
jgi:putative glutathione S-transferase